MNWTTPGDLKAQVHKLWDNGQLLAALDDAPPSFSKRFKLKAPTSKELSERFGEVQDWINQLSKAAGLYRIEWRTVKHRVLGANQIPTALWIDQLDDALQLIGKKQAAAQYTALIKLTAEKQPALLDWLRQHPLNALNLAADWPELLAIVEWIQHHPRPDIYLRQVDLPGIHTKFIEAHRSVLSQLLDRVLPESAIDTRYSGLSGFARRYGFLEKPLPVRFRILDPQIRLLPASVEQDIILTQTAFAALELAPSKVFMTENEVNFLAFPPLPDAMVIFGAGYGFRNLVSATWLAQKQIYYWGDIDTHGFAILNQLRDRFAHARSFLMDQATLLAHRPLWGFEPQPETSTLTHLSAEESMLYDQLRNNHWGNQVRLEQERIGFEYLRAALHDLI